MGKRPEVQNRNSKSVTSWWCDLFRPRLVPYGQEELHQGGTHGVY